MRLITAPCSRSSRLLALSRLRAAAQDERSEGVEQVYADYRDDGVIEACDHSRRALRRTLRGARARGRPRHARPAPGARGGDRAARVRRLPRGGGDADPDRRTRRRRPTPAPAPCRPPPTTPSTPATTRRRCPPPTRATAAAEQRSPPPAAEDVTPLDPAVTPVPPAAAVRRAVRRADRPARGARGGLRQPRRRRARRALVLAGLLALLALLALLVAVASRLGWADARSPAARRAWREATFRAGGTWGDFADWIRLGR